MPFYAFIPLMPVVAFVVLLALGRRAKSWAHLVAIPLISVSFVLALVAAARAAAHAPMHVTFEWARVGGAVMRFGLMVDPLTAVMLVVVTFIALLVQIYSIGYMHGEDRYGWYYAVLSLFTAAMLVLVLADDYLLMYMGWEGVGLCSYLLIGFWFEEEEPRLASMKAFIVTRLGDVGFGLGVISMFALAGTFAFDGVFASSATWGAGAVTAVALLLFCGAAGKSAQFPLHVWLPDAMAGPTPVSALIHAATMVAAGVYLVARSAPLFHQSEAAMVTVLVIGALTALGAGLTAAVVYDIKKILAYSTISQLGYMMMALGAGSVVAGMFHLTTHAFFKALLFLGSGSIIHATHTQDIRRMSGLAKAMPITAVTFIVGSLALAGIAPLSGFFSKDEILLAINAAETPHVIAGLHVHQFVLAVAIVVAMLTAFYMSRLCFRVFWGGPVKAHESPWVMTAPLIVLMFFAVVAGWFAGPFAAFLLPEAEHHAFNGALAFGPFVLAVIAIVLGYLIYYKRVLSVAGLVRRFRLLYLLVSNRFYMDEFYQGFVVTRLLGACRMLARFDLGVIDWIVNAAARLTMWAAEQQRRFDEGVIDRVVEWTAGMWVVSGRALRYVQSGSVQAYVQLMVAALVVLMVWFVLKGV